MKCLCIPFGSQENDTGVLSQSQQQQQQQERSKSVGFRKDDDDQTYKEYIPPALPPGMYSSGGSTSLGVADNFDARNNDYRKQNSIAEGGQEVEDTDSQFFFDAKEECDKLSIADFKSTQGDGNADAAAELTDGEFATPQSTGSNKGFRLSAKLLSKHVGTPSIRSGTTTSSKRRARLISMEEPESLLHEKQSIGRRSVQSFRNSMQVIGFLKKPRVVVDEKGFPGNLTQKQLDAVMHFRSELSKRAASTSNYKDGNIYPEMVGSFRDVEEEPYALCRFLRARDFNVDQVFEMMDEHVEIWKEAKKFDYYPDVDAAMGCPLSVVLTQYPILYSGNAKQGYPICYFHAGRLTVSGIECITTLESIPIMMWNTMMYQVAGIFRDATDANPDFVRCEQITVINLEGLSASQINSRTINVIKQANAVAECFPEMLFKCIIINAPSFFAMTWRIISAFLDATTTTKIELYSNKKKGHKRLTELIDEKSLPSDFDGKGPSTQEILCQSSVKNGEQPPKRRIVELVSVKKGGGEGSLDFDLKPNEMMKLQVYTRSEIGAHFSIYKYSGVSKSKNKTPIVKIISVTRTEHGSNDDISTPFSADLVDDLEGEGEYVLVGKSDKKTKSTDYFLVIGNVYG